MRRGIVFAVVWFLGVPANGSPVAPCQVKPTPASPTPAVSIDKARATSDAEAEITRLQQRGVSMLREAAHDSVTLEDRRSIARIQARAASALWKFDRDSARELFEQAFETAVTHYREAKNTDSGRLPNGLLVSRADVRQEVIRAATKFEPALAKTMTERFIEEKSREIAESLAKAAQNSPQGKADSQSSLLGKADPAGAQMLSLSSSLLDTDREMSVELARRAFAASISPNAAGYLVSLANIDRRAADQLFLLALATLGSQEPFPGQLLVLSAYPFGEDRILLSDGNSNSSYGFGKPRAFEIDPTLIKAFFARAVDVLTRTAQINTAQFPDLVPRVNSGLFAASYLEAKIAQYEPGLAERWQLITSALYGAVTESSRTGVSRSLENMTRDSRPVIAGDAEDRIKALLDQAEKTSDLARRDEQYSQAALAAGRAGDMTRALGIVDKISDSDFRQSVRDWLNFDASNEALSEKRIDEAQRYATDVGATDQRAYLLFQIAKSLLKENRTRAIDLLEEATRHATAADNTAEKLRALLGISSVYAGIDPARAFDIGTEAMKVAGKVSDYGPDTTTLFRALKRQGGSGTSYSSSTADEFDVGKTLAILARSDLERALGLARSIESKPLQLLTIVAVATTLLDSK